MLVLQGRNVVLESKYGSPRIVNDGVTVAKEVELEDPVENIGAKLVRQVCQVQSSYCFYTCIAVPCASAWTTSRDHITHESVSSFCLICNRKATGNPLV